MNVSQNLKFWCFLYVSTTVGINLCLSDGIYEGFDFSITTGDLIGSSDATRAGQTSAGWHSTWYAVSGKSLASQDDIAIDGLLSAGGSADIRGERKSNSLGKGILLRQIDQGYVGDLYGSFRFRSGKLLRDSVVGLLLSLPSSELPTPRTATFAFCPKRWGGEFGMLGAGEGKIVKVQSGVACKQDETYLVVWKLDNLPEPGKRRKIGLHMWVLNTAQAAHFSTEGFDEAVLTTAELGAEPGQVCQSAHRIIRDSKRGVFRGMLVSCFSTGLPRVSFDEIKISPDGFSAVVGASDAAH